MVSVKSLPSLVYQTFSLPTVPKNNSKLLFSFTKMPLLMLFCHFVANLLVGKPNLWSNV